MKRLFLLLAIILFGVISCKKKEDEKSDMYGDLNVRVTTQGNHYVERAEVYTNPPSKTGTTDEYGSVLLRDVAIGSYEVFAELKNIGTGKSVVYVRGNTLWEINVNIDAEFHIKISPVITIVLPLQPAEFVQGEEIIFSADVEDDTTPNQDIKIIWESSIDGVINTNPPNINGNTTFSTSSLSRGLHQITITAEDLDGNSTSETISVNTSSPNAVTLLEPIKDSGKVILAWTEYVDTDFLKYEVYRNEGSCTEQNIELLATISDKGITSFTDEFPPLEFQACYFIRVFNTDTNARNSNHEVVDSPSGHVFSFNAYDMLKHPTETYIYLIDQGGRKLIKFDYASLEVVNEANLQGEIGYCDIGDNGFGIEIYAPSDDGKIFVYNADDLSLTTTIITDGPAIAAVANGLGHVIASMRTNFKKPVRSYSRSNGIHIDSNSDDLGNRLRMIPGTNEIISISVTLFSSPMGYLRLSDDGYFEISHEGYHPNFPMDYKILRVSDGGTYSITSKEGAVYLANRSMEYKGQLQNDNLLFSDFAFSEDDAIIYAATSNKKSIQIRHYPSLAGDDEILTRGFPIFIVRDGNKLISLSKSTEESINTGIEVIDL